MNSKVHMWRRGCDIGIESEASHEDCIKLFKAWAYYKKTGYQDKRFYTGTDIEGMFGLDLDAVEFMAIEELNDGQKQIGFET